VIASLLAAPATSVNVPKLELEVMPLIVAAPESVMLPLASGLPAVGRTLIPDHVSLERAAGFPPDWSCALTVMVMVEVVTVAVELLSVSRVLLPVSSRETVTVTVEDESNSNPLGALKTIVPVPISRLAPSSSTGPVSVVYAPVPPEALVVSAEMLALAKVLTDAVANA